MPGISAKSERDFEAESDARDLMRAIKIKSDPKRLTRAMKALDKIEKEAERTRIEVKAARGLKNVFSKDT